MLTTLHARPICRASDPRYPTRLAVLADPDLLARHLPPNWRGKAEITGLLSVALAASAAGCRQDAGSAGTTTQPMSPPVGAALVAPVFEHGNGTGPGRWTLGCIAVAAPSFLPEEEALAVVREEMAKHGVTFAGRNEQLPGVEISGFELKKGLEWAAGKYREDLFEMTAPLEADLVDPAHHIVVEYVSDADFWQLGGNDRREYNRDLKAVAQQVATQVSAQAHNVTFAAFYDPVRYYTFGRGRGRVDDRWSASEEDAKRYAQEQLRLQVQDFIAWLKGQGVI